MWTAALWGLFAGAALLLGAGLALILPVPNKVIGAVMGFGAGVLVSAVAFELTAEAIDEAGMVVVPFALMTGAAVYIAGDWAISNDGGHRRNSPLHGGTFPHLHARLRIKHLQEKLVAESSGAVATPAPATPATATPAATSAATAPRRQAPVVAATGSAGALVLGTLLDGIPESAAIGISLLDGKGVGLAFVAAVFLSNIPEGMSASAGLKASGRSTRWILGLWLAIAVVFVELWAISWIRYKYMDTPFLKAAFQIAVGGFLVFLTGILIGSA